MGFSDSQNNQKQGNTSADVFPSPRPPQVTWHVKSKNPGSLIYPTDTHSPVGVSIYPAAPKGSSRQRSGGVCASLSSRTNRNKERVSKTNMRRPGDVLIATATFALLLGLVSVRGKSCFQLQVWSLFGQIRAGVLFWFLRRFLIIATNFVTPFQEAQLLTQISVIQSYFPSLFMCPIRSEFSVPFRVMRKSGDLNDN